MGIKGKLSMTSSTMVWFATTHILPEHYCQNTSFWRHDESLIKFDSHFLLADCIATHYTSLFYVRGTTYRSKELEFSVQPWRQTSPCCYLVLLMMATPREKNPGPYKLDSIDTACEIISCDLLWPLVSWSAIYALESSWKGGLQSIQHDLNYFSKTKERRRESEEIWTYLAHFCWWSSYLVSLEHLDGWL